MRCGGAEEPERKRRPYLVLTRNSAIGTLHEVLVAAVTRTVRPIPTQVELDEGDGMPVPCAVVCDLSGEWMAAVCTALDVATEC